MRAFTDSDTLGKYSGAVAGITPDTRQRLAVASLIAWNEKLAAAGSLPATDEETLRKLIAETLSAFKMPTRAERQLETI